jgi:hypothetical protein
MFSTSTPVAATVDTVAAMATAAYQAWVRRYLCHSAVASRAKTMTDNALIATLIACHWNQ